MSIIEEALRRTHQEGPVASLPSEPAGVSAVRPILKASSTSPRRSSAPALTAALVILGVFGATLLVRYSLAKSPSVVPATGTTPMPESASATTLPPTSMPMTPGPAPVATAPKAPFTVSGVMMSPGESPLAIINGRIVAEGDPVDGAVVERIEQGRVVLRSTDGQELSLAVVR